MVVSGARARLRSEVGHFRITKHLLVMTRLSQGLRRADRLTVIGSQMARQCGDDTRAAMRRSVAEDVPGPTEPRPPALAGMGTRARDARPALPHGRGRCRGAGRASVLGAGATHRRPVHALS